MSRGTRKGDETWAFDKRKRGGFEPVERIRGCRSMDHNPPSHLYIPAGQQYRHICSGCGRETVLQSPDVTCAV